MYATDLWLARGASPRSGFVQPFLQADWPPARRLSQTLGVPFNVTDVLNHYIPNGGLFTRVYDGHWTDAGTVPSLLRAAELAAKDDADGRPSPPAERPPP